MSRLCAVATLVLVTLGFVSRVPAQPAPAKPQPDARFGNWLYKTPDPKLWSRTEKDGALVFSAAEPPGDFCTLTLFAGQAAGADFAGQFNGAIAADQLAKGTIKIEADSGAKPSKSAEGFDVLTRSLRSETATLHTLHIYVGGHSGDRFEVAAFQASSESAWKQYGLQASQFIQSLKVANSLAPAEVDRLLGVVAAPPPTLPGFDDIGAAPPSAGASAVAAAKEAAAAGAPAANVPEVPLEKSPLVINHAVIQKNGKPIDAIKVSQHDLEIYSPSLAVSSTGVIQAAFVEKHRTTYALAVYHRSSADGGKTWTEAKNLSEDMPGINVGRCYVLVDGSDRVYVVWRAGLAVYHSASPDPGNSGPSNLMYRVLENSRWSRIIPVHPVGSAEKQDDGSLAYFATVDAAGRAQVVWNAAPDHWHPEFTATSGTYHQHIAGIGNGLVFQATLDGTNPGVPREVFMTPVLGREPNNAYSGYSDGLDNLNGYVDAGGSPHFVAAMSATHDDHLRGKSRYQLIENGKEGPFVDLPELSFHAWHDYPNLLVDAAGRRHLVVLYPAGEHPNIRDYLIGTEEEPVIIREAASVKGSADGFQAYQGPGGRMIAIMEMNDSGVRAEGETYVSVSNGGPWSTPVNVTNNAGRRSFASTQHGAAGVAISKSYYPGPAAATIDRDGHVLLLMINNEYGLFGTSAFGVSMSGGSSSTPTLQFLRF